MKKQSSALLTGTLGLMMLWGQGHSQPLGQTSIEPQEPFVTNETPPQLIPQTPAYIAPTPGTRLNEFFTVQEASWAPGCLIYVHNEGGAFFIEGKGGGFSVFHPNADKAYIVLEQQPDGMACPEKHPTENIPLVLLRQPIRDNGASYTLELPDRTCEGGKGKLYWCRWIKSTSPAT